MPNPIYDSLTLPKLSPRSPDSHKGDYGRALLIGGSRGMAGAIALAGMATLRSGAGLVRLAVADCCQAIVAGFEPSYMTLGLPSDDAGRLDSRSHKLLAEPLEQATVFAVGPGLGRSDDVTELVRWLYRTIERPAVFDADALFALAGWEGLAERPPAPRVLTPHPGEFARLLGREKIPAHEREALAEQFAAQSHVTLVLKGHRSIITDGVRVVLNETGNPGMATGGTGDVLTGIITGLLAMGLDPFDAAHLGAHVHGRAGDLAATELGETSLIANDLLRFLPTAYRELNSDCAGAS